MKLEENKSHPVVTRSMQPLLFEINEFLSHKECDLLIQLSQRSHLTDSLTTNGKGEGISRDELEKKMATKNLNREKSMLCRKLQRPVYDSDRDEKITLQEFVRFLDREKYVYPTKEDALPIFSIFDLNSDGFVDDKDCADVTNTTYVEFLFRVEKLKSDPRYFIRFSESAVLSRDRPIVRTLQRRIAKLTGLSKTLIEKSEEIQVVRYSVSGHYNAHYDTTHGPGSARLKECCRDGQVTQDCHLCRFMTILLYLNDVSKGGETAFPLADDPQRFYTRNYSYSLNERSRCREANLLIQPKKGKAVVWYNHLLERDGDDHMGDLDLLSLHGGCDVVEGVKWIANVWLNAPFRKEGNS
ncbi:Transmembrane prolyl 4-hydroxylase [Stylophora pistillata]|uniref:Transmembrane prolyl 4-hydroxylase n=2 Tax=Stylophora pistillata TaxID=50429 RepID=A0A2B4SEL1_STYPI|nr:Transmembrane prolyl 4-hydroxylase [Stylophora pistillata]